MIKYYVIVCNFYMEEKMNLSDILSKRKGNRSDNNQENAEHKQENSPFAGFRNYTLTWKERYEIAVRFGILVKIKGEEIKVPNFVKVKEISEEEKNIMLADLSKNQKGQLMSHSKVSEFLNIEDKLLKNGISAGELKDKYLKELTLINIYLHTLIPDNKQDKAKIILEINKHIINAIGSAAKNLDSNYIIDFIDVLYNQFGDKIKPGKYNTIITRMAQSDNNQMLLELVRTITEDFDFQDYEMLLTIIEILQKKKVFPLEHEVSLDDYSNDERTCQRYNELKSSNDLRNLDLSMLKDIISATDFKEKNPEDIEKFIKKVSNLNSKNLNNFWLQYSGVEATYEVMLERLNNYLDSQNSNKSKRKITGFKKFPFPEKKFLLIAGISMIIGTLSGIGISNVLNNSEEKSIKGTLSEDLTMNDGNVLTKGTNVKIILDKKSDTYSIVPDTSLSFDESDITNNRELARIIEDLLKQNEAKSKSINKTVDEKVEDLKEPEEDSQEMETSSTKRSYVDE